MQHQAYDQLCKVEDTYWYSHGVRKLTEIYLKRIYNELTGPLNILDVGSGTGGIFDLLKTFGDVTGLELSDYAAELCRKKHPDAIMTIGSANNLSNLFTESSFDIITFVNVLYHKWIEDDQDVLKQASDVVKPGGYIISVDSAFKFLYRDNDKICYGVRRYSRKDIREKLNNAGFSLVASSYFNSISFFPALLLSAIQRFGILKANHASDELRELPKLINQTLKGVMFFERAWINMVSPIPFGVSLLSVARKV